MARQKQDARQQQAATPARMTIEAALALVESRPTRLTPYSAAENEVLRQVYPAYASRCAVRELAALWPRLTGVARTSNSLIVHAVRLGVGGGRKA